MPELARQLGPERAHRIEDKFFYCYCCYYLLFLILNLFLGFLIPKLEILEKKGKKELN